MEVASNLESKTHKSDYEKPVLKRLDNIKDITFDCVGFSCSIAVPPPPGA